MRQSENNSWSAIFLINESVAEKLEVELKTKKREL